MCNLKNNFRQQRKFEIKFVILILLFLALYKTDCQNTIKKKYKIKKSRLNNNKYNFKILDNGMESLMITNPKLNKSACGLSISTGSFNDTIPGISHLIEHLFFLGKTKYNQNCSFKDYIEKHHGSVKAFTCKDITIYFFDIDTQYFVRALKLFIELFKITEFTIEQLKTAVNEIDQESETYQENNCFILEYLVCKLSNEPYNILIYENKNVLLQNYEENDGNNVEEINKKYEKLREMAENLRQTNYDISKVKLTTYHKYNLQSIIKRCCKSIKSQNEKISMRKSNSYNLIQESIKKIYKNKYTNKFIYAEPFYSLNKIIIYIEIPNSFYLSKNNTINYLQFILMGKHNESLIYQYKKGGYAKDIQINIEKNLVYSYLEIIIQLTELGLKDKGKILNDFYNYLYKLTYSEKEYNFYKAKFSNDFMYMENESPIDHVHNLVKAMQYYSIENVLNHNYIYEKFDESEMKRLLETIKNYNNWLVIVFDIFDTPKDTNIVIDEYLKFKYKLSDEIVIKNDYEGDLIQQNKITPRLENLKNLSTLKQPIKYSQQNIDVKPGMISFIKDMFYNKPKEIFLNLKDEYNEIKVTEKESEFNKFTFIHNPSYNTPRSKVGIELNTELTSENYIEFHLYLKMMYEFYMEKHKDYLFLSSVEFEYKLNKTGIELSFYGLTENIINCILCFFDIFLDHNNPNLILINDDSIKTYDNFTVKTPIDAVFETIENDILGFLPSTKEYYSKKESIKLKDIILVHKYYLNMFVCSNGTQEEFLALFESISAKFTQSTRFIHEIRNENKILNAMTTSLNHNAVGIFLKSQKFSNLKSLAITKIFLPHLNSTFYNQLRIQEKLGYIVEVGSYIINKLPYIFFVIQSDKDCDFLTVRIKDFIEDMKKELKLLNEKDFMLMKKSAINTYKEKIQNLKLYFTRFKHLYDVNAFDINYQDRMIKQIKSIKIEDLTLPDDMIVVEVQKKNKYLF